MAHIPGPAFGEEAAKCRFHITDYTCSHQVTGEMRAADNRPVAGAIHCAPKATLDTHVRQTLPDELRTPQASFPYAMQPLLQGNARRIHIKPEDVQRPAVPTGRDFDPGNQCDSVLLGTRRRCTQPVEGVVIGQCEHPHAAAGGTRDKRMWREAAVGAVGVAVQIDREQGNASGVAES